MVAHCKRRILFCFVILAVSLIIASPSSLAQTAGDLKQSVEASAANWKRFVSAEGRFAILFPGSPTLSEQSIDHPLMKFVVRKCELKTFAEYGVMYADYPENVIKATPADMLLDEGAKGAVEELHSELVSISPITIAGYPGRLMKEKLPSGQILQAKMVLVGQRMYQIAITTPKEEGAAAEAVGFYESTARKFLDSFELVNSQTFNTQEAKPSCPPDASNCFSTEALTARAISIPEPEYPAIAHAAHAEGTVDVLVRVDEEGNVISAAAMKGHPLLQAAAVRAARNAKFTPLIVNDKAVQFGGVLQYKFALDQ